MSTPAVIEPEYTMPRLDPDDLPKSLGYGVADWIEQWLVQPDGDNAGEPYRLTQEQLAFVVRWYSVDDRGRYVYRTGMKVDAKGKGKSILAAALLLAEFLGPVRFDRFDAFGNAIGKAHPTPWVVLGALSESQTTNTYAAILGMLDGSPVVEHYGIDVGQTRLFIPGGGRLHPITASSRSQEGARPTAALIDEVHHLTESNGGKKLYEVIKRNCAKAAYGASRLLMTTNGWEPGEDSVAETFYRAWVEQQELPAGAKLPGGRALVDMASAPLWVDIAKIDQLEAALRGVYHDAPWIDIDTLVAEFFDSSTPVEVLRRFYLGQIVSSGNSWVSAVDYDMCLKEFEPLAPGDTIVLGFDGSLTDDSTVLMAIRVADEVPAILGLWEKPQGAMGKDWVIDKNLVHDAVDHAFSTYDVVAFFSDVAYWEADVEAWREQYASRLLVSASSKNVIAFDMRGNQQEITRAAESLSRAIQDHAFVQLGDKRMRRHFLNARRRLNKYGVTFGKVNRESPDKVDVVAATLLARMARNLIIHKDALSKRKRPRTGRVVGF